MGRLNSTGLAVVLLLPELPLGFGSGAAFLTGVLAPALEGPAFRRETQTPRAEQLILSRVGFGK
eukprot:9259041-Pyramimonas_sp.AAC.1